MAHCLFRRAGGPVLGYDLRHLVLVSGSVSDLGTLWHYFRKEDFGVGLSDTVRHLCIVEPHQCLLHVLFGR